MSWREEENRKKDLLRETYHIIDFGKEKIVYNTKTKHYYKPLYPDSISSYGFARVKPKKTFSEFLPNYYFDAFYDGNKLKLVFEVGNGNGNHKETVPCEEYFPEILLNKIDNKEQLVNSVIILNNKNIDLQNKIDDILKELQIYSNYNNTLDELADDELRDKANILDEENKKLEKEFEKLKSELKQLKK